LKKKLHIICFTVPYPVNYGGVFDLFYILPALKEAGIGIQLHCFDYGRGQQPELNHFCEQVYYYSRQEGHKGISSGLPYIVSSRKNEQLLLRLMEDDYPILMHGIHCTYLLTDARFNDRHCVVRLHNTEHLYYRQLAGSSRSLIKSLYFYWESCQLKSFEKKISGRGHFVAVSPLDVTYYREQFQAPNISYLPVFLPPWDFNYRGTMGFYCLYHGDLQVPVNEQTAIRLLTRIFNKLAIPLVIAGRNPSPTLIELAHREQFTCLVANPSDAEMEDMIVRAHVHVLPAQHNTGIQLKLLHALFSGRHCVSNKAGVSDPELAKLVHTAETDESLMNLIAQLYRQPFSEEDFFTRKHDLEKIFNVENQTRQLLEILYPSDSQ